MSIDRISVDPKIMGGMPCIRDTRITVTTILKMLANEAPFNEVLDAYPELENIDIIACLEYAAWATSDRTMRIDA